MSAILQRQSAPAASINPQLVPQFQQIVEKALERDREVRYQSAAELRADLKRLRRDADSAHVSTASHSAYAGSAATRERSWRATAGTAAALGALAIAAWFIWLRPSTDYTSNFLANATFSRLTDQAGLESFPSLSPDGKSIVLLERGLGQLWTSTSSAWRAGTPPTSRADSSADDTQPAFSPDGTRIAFRSERGGGGIFVMGATGEAVRRLSDVGYNPSWSPDGRFIVCAQETIEQPASRYSNASALWVIDVSTGERRQITGGRRGAALVVAARSPHRLLGGRRDRAAGPLDDACTGRRTGGGHQRPLRGLESHLVAGRAVPVLLQ